MMLPKALKDVAVTAAIKVASENPNLSNNSIAKNVTLKKSLRNYINIILHSAAKNRPFLSLGNQLYDI